MRVFIVLYIVLLIIAVYMSVSRDNNYEILRQYEDGSFIGCYEGSPCND